jgi:hypothetical protein
VIFFEFETQLKLFSVLPTVFEMIFITFDNFSEAVAFNMNGFLSMNTIVLHVKIAFDYAVSNQDS